MRLLARLLATALMAVCVGAVVVAPARAADNGSWAVTPTPPKASSAAPRNYFVLDAAPGTRIKDSLRIQNLTGRTISFTVYGADGFNTTKDGFFALKGVEEAQSDIGSWVRLPFRKIDLAGHTQVDVPFTIRVPENATPGDHVGGVVALNSAVEGLQKQGDIDIGIQRAVGARLYLRVDGPLTPGLAVSDVKVDTDRGALPWSGSGTGTVSYTLTNTGNVRLSPETAVTVGGLAGHEAKPASPGGVVDLLPGQKVRLAATVSGIRWFDRLDAEVVATSAEGASARGDTVAWQTPWTGLIVGLLLACGAGFLVHRRRTAAARGMQNAEQAPVLDLSGKP